MIDSMGGRDIETVAITGGFIQTEYDKGDVHIQLERHMTTLLIDIDQEY